MSNCETCGCKVGKGNTYRYKDGMHTYCAKCRHKREVEKKNADTRVRNHAYKIVKELVLERGRKCEKCGKEGPVHGHHIHPLRSGGKNTKSNLVLLCVSCHRAAHPNGTKYD